MAIKGFWREFVSGNNEVVHSPTVIIAGVGLILAAPVVALSSATVIYHVFLLRKGLDPATVNLLLGMLGAATGGLIGGSLYSKYMPGGPLPPKANPAQPGPN